jgi:lipopolysaccharide export system permease protein
VPIYELPGFIAQLNAAGFAALQHRIWLQMQLSNPLMLSAMVLIGAGFTMRTRASVAPESWFLRRFCSVLGCISSAISPKFLGRAGSCPPPSSRGRRRWRRSCLAVGVLLHTEDG